MKTFLMMLVVGVALQASAQNEQPPAVKHPIRIMVGSFNADHYMFPLSPELIRSKLVSSLSRQCKNTCVVTELGYDDDTQVDAILTGSWHATEGDCWNCRPNLQGAIRLVAKDGTVLWSDTVHNSLFARSISSSFADNVAKKLVSHLASKPLPAAGK